MAAEDYVGPPYHEKKFHKTHFSAPGVKLRTTKPAKYIWVEVGVGRFKLIRKVDHGKEKNS